MIGMQHQGDIEGTLHHVVGTCAGQSVEEVGGKAESGIAGDHGLAAAQTVEGGDDGGGGGHQPDRLALVGLG